MSSGLRFETEIPGDLSRALQIPGRVVGLMEQLDYSHHDAFAMRLAVEEAVTNAVKHGSKGDQSRTVTVRCEVDDQRVLVVVSDQGPGFIPEDVPDPRLPEFIERTTGRGLVLMRAYLDRCEYNSRGNQITMERRRNSPRPVIDD